MILTWWRRLETKAQRAARVKAWHKANPSRVAAAKKRWRDRNPEKQRQCSEDYRAANPYTKRRGNWRRQGIDVEVAEAMLRGHDGKCALCRCEKPGGTGRQWHVDHDHETGKVRGVLCAGCNLALGRVERVGVDKFSKYLRGSGRTAD